jgi:ankyrin repeat protein
LLGLLALLALGSIWLADRVGAADSPVAAAARTGNLAAVRALIQKRADVNLPENDGSTALLWAVYHADVSMTRALVAAGARVDAANRYGVTPLLQASRTGDAAVMQVLLEAGANPSPASPDAETPLMAASRAGRTEAVHLLLARGADVNGAGGAQKQTALMWAAAEGHLDVVRTLLEVGADANLKGHVTSFTKREHADHPTGGFTALMFAVRNGHEAVARTLVARGADLKAANGDGATAMSIAIVNDRFDLAAALLDLGADPDDGSLYHAVDMHDATTDMRARDGSQLRANHPNRLTSLDLVKLLLERGADPNKRAVGALHSTTLCCGDFANGTPFYRAAIAADVEVLKLMIARGAQIEWVPSEVKNESEGQGGGAGRGANANVGRTPMMVAMAGGRGAAFGAGPGFNREGAPPFRETSNRTPVEALKVLLAAGANPNAKAPDGSTPLHQASDRGSLEMIRVLVEAGAALDAKNKENLTPLELIDKKIADAAAGKGRGAGPAGGGGGAGRGGDPPAKPEEVAALLRQLMGLPPAPAPAAGTPQ